MTKIVFSSDQLPTELSNSQRYALWRDIYESTYTAFDFSCLPDRPFFARLEFVQCGSVGLARFDATLNGVIRSRAQIARHPRDYLCIAFPSQDCTIVQTQGREAVHGPGTVLLTNEAEPTRFAMPRGSSWTLLDIPRDLLLRRVPHAEDLAATRINANPQVLTHLKRYANLVLQGEESTQEPQLAACVGEILLDLAELALSESADGGDQARARGLRAARLRETLAEIERRFADPALSSDDIAKTLGLSRRYINELLFESGLNFTDRILELRLQKVRAMLADVQCDAMKVSDIAFACGFSDISYFNRRFRARFGCSPTQYRGSGKAG